MGARKGVCEKDNDRLSHIQEENTQTHGQAAHGHYQRIPFFYIL